MKERGFTSAKAENKGLGLFGGKVLPDLQAGMKFWNDTQAFNERTKLAEIVRTNENFYIGKQWEGVESNGLPTPQFNFLKRVVGFVVATVTTDNIHVTASPLSNTLGTQSLVDPARIVNEEFEALTEQNRLPSLIREFARNSAVDGDGCLYTYWDENAENGQSVKGRIVTEVIENTHVRFGNPNDRRVQTQPYIIIDTDEIVRDVKRRALENGIETWEAITEDEDNDDAVDSAKRTGDKCNVKLLMWRATEEIIESGTGEKLCSPGDIMAFEFCTKSVIRKPYNMNIKLYPINWLPWDFVADSYHGHAMITGLIPNQIFVNKIWAASMLSFLKTAYPKIIFDKTRISKWDNGVGRAIGINGGDVNTVAKIMDPAQISPQISQFIQLAVEMTEQSLGATSVALGDTRPDNTSAIIALQRAASTPTELTKQNLYQSIEDLFRIYLEFMGAFYGTRKVDTEPPEKVSAAASFAGQELPDEVEMDFDFSMLQEHPMMLKLDVGASSYYSEIASMQTLDNLLMNNHITVLQYLERIPDGYIPARRALIAELKREQVQAALPPAPPPEAAPPGGEVLETGEKPEVPTGSGFGALQRKVLEQGTTEGLV